MLLGVAGNDQAALLLLQYYITYCSTRTQAQRYLLYIQIV
jgi:hypothetical protein